MFIPFAFVSFAQTKGIQYQAVIQDPSPYQIPGTFIQGQVLQNKTVTIRFTLKTNNSIDFEELHETQTDEFGLINLTIGKGKKSTGSNFDQLVWSGQNKVLVVAVKIEGQSNFLEVSNQTLLYSPYALYADAVEYKNINNSPKDVSFFKNDVGYLVSNDLKPLEKKINDNQTENLNSFALLKNQQIALETKVDEQGKKINETINITQNLISRVDQQNSRIDQQNAQINQNQNTLINQINGLGGSFESLGNKSTAIDLGNSNPSNQFYPSQRAVKTYVDQVISTVVVSGTPDATSLAAGKIQLAGDLGGSASVPTVPGLLLKENLTNKTISIPTDSTSDIKYPSARAVKTYVDQATRGTALIADLNAKANISSPTFTGTPSLPTGTFGVLQLTGTNTTQLATTSFVQQELNAANSSKENVANKSTSTTLGTSDVFYPTQNAVKQYVDNQIGTATPDASLTRKGKILLGGDLASGSSTAENPIIRDNAITTNKILDSAVTNAKVLSISGTKITGNIAGESSNVTGTVMPVHGGTGAAGTLNGYIKGNGNSAMQAVSVIPVGDITGAESTANKSNNFSADSSSTTKYPSVNAVKNYIDGQIAQGTIPDATTSVYGKIKLGGDLAGAGSTAAAPLITENSITTGKIANLAVSDAKIVGISGTKISGDINGKAANVTGIVSTTNGGTGAQATLTGYIKGNGASAMTGIATIPVADVTGAELITNKSIATDLGNSSPSDQLYPSQKAVKAYVDASTGGSIGSTTQAALDLKENTSNKSNADIQGNSQSLFPTQHAVKNYVETKLATQTVSLNNLQTINPDKLIGNFGGSAARPGEISTSGTGNVVRVSGATLSNVSLNGTIGGNVILATTNGGLGTASLSSGYVKAGNPFTTVSAIPVTDVTGAVQKVNGNTPDANGNVTLLFGRTYTGVYNGGNFSSVVSSPINSDVYIVSSDPTTTNNGRAFIYDGALWNEITTDQAALDARFVRLSGSTMSGNLTFPAGRKIQIADAPTSQTDVANKAYVDGRIVDGATPNATITDFGKIRLGGDLAGTSTSATDPIISNNAITTAKIADGAVTDDKVSGIISGAKGGTGVNNSGKSITLGGNLTTIGLNTLSLTTSGNTAVTLPTAGTLSTLAGTEALTNKSINGLSLTSSLTGFTIAGGTTSKTLTVANNASVSGTNTGDQTITLDGDATGSGTAGITVTLANTGVIAGVYGSNALIPQITVDTKGRISNVSEISLSNTTLAGTILNDGKVLIGNGSNAAVERNLSGDVTMNNTGVTTIGNGKVTNAMLAGSIDLSSKVNNILPLANGGTGLSSLTANALIVGGTSLGFISPGASGNILRSDGTTWNASSISSLGVATSVGALNTTGTSNGMTLLGGELKLSPADQSNPGVITTGTQSMAGAKTFTQDLIVNQITLGNGGGNLISNTRLGNASFTSNTTGSNNTAVGYQSLQNNSSGSNNTALGAGSLANNLTGNGNTALGNGAGVATGNLNNILALGNGAIVSTDNTIQLGNSSVTRLNTNAAINAGSIQNTPIGSTTANSGAFTTLKTTGSAANQVLYTDANNLIVSASSLPVTLGGTGLATIPANGVLIGNGTGNISTITPSATGQVLTWNGTTWTTTIPTAITVGALGTSNANGLAITNNVLNLSAADATNPGIVTTGIQTFAGAKTFTGAINATTLTATKVVFTDVSKNLTSSGTVGVAQGGTGVGTLTSGAILVGASTSPISSISPGTDGQILVSRSGAWSVENASPVVSIGNVNNSSNAKGLTITAGGEISLSPANATNPGIMTTGAQTFAGDKTFANIISSGDGSVGGDLIVTGSLNNMALTASKVVFTDALKNLSSTGTVGVSQGGTGASTFTTGGIIVGNGTSALSTINPGTNGQILVSRLGAWSVENASPTVTLGTVNTSSTAKGLTITAGGEISLSPADATNAGIITTAAQTFAGAKTFTSITSSGDGSIGGNLSITGNVTNSALTASKVVFTDISKNLSSSGTVGVAQGGTGLASIPLNGVVIGNGTSSIATIVPSSNGQVLTWNGTSWTATIPTAISVGPVGTSTTNGLTISNNVLSLSPADATNPGIVNTGVQTFAGAKTFASIISSGNSSVGGTLSVTGNLTNSALTASKVVFSDASKILSSTGTVGVDQGGTGATTLTSGALLIGNGTGSVTSLAPSTAGYILKVVGSTWTVSAPDTDESDQFTATVGQTSFTLTQTPASNSKIQMFINGIRIDKNAYSVSGRIVTYTPALNSAFELAADDRIQFDYEY